MTNNEKIRAFVQKAVGCPYVYGATGQKCTTAYRKARMEQYPGSADAIRKNCNVLSGKAEDCGGCKYSGKKAYDCAQLTRYAAKEAGLTLPSGATSQWNKGDWALKGTIDSLPVQQVCFLYLERDGKMGHTGVYLGDGTAVDARGHSAGVVHRALTDVAWTHWAVLNGQEIENEPAKEEPIVAKYIVAGTRLALREKPSSSASVLLRMDTGTEIIGEAVDTEWVKVTCNGRIGYSMAKFLTKVGAEASHPVPPAEEELTDKEKLDLLWAWYREAMAS